MSWACAACAFAYLFMSWAWAACDSIDHAGEIQLHAQKLKNSKVLSESAGWDSFVDQNWVYSGRILRWFKANLYKNISFQTETDTCGRRVKTIRKRYVAAKFIESGKRKIFFRLKLKTGACGRGQIEKVRNLVTKGPAVTYSKTANARSICSICDVSLKQCSFYRLLGN